MPHTLEELSRLLDLEQIDVGLFRGAQPVTRMQRAFGGQVLGQALMAASRTVEPGRPIHSLHAYFLRPGGTTTPIIYDVEATRDGGSFSSRRVTARQQGATIFTLSASFHADEPGFEHAEPMPIDVPAPEDCEPIGEWQARIMQRPASLWDTEFGVLDGRFAGASVVSDDDGTVGTVTSRLWLRVKDPLEVPSGQDADMWQRAALAYASDISLLSATLVPHFASLTDAASGVQMASLDHSMWFHRPFLAHDWILYDQQSPSARGAIGLATGRLFQHGSLIASVAQEGLIRPVTRPDSERHA